MVNARTTTNYKKENLERYGKYLSDYRAFLKDGGKSDSSIDGTIRYINAFLSRCPPMPVEDLDSEIFAEVSVMMEADNLGKDYVTRSLKYMGRFVEFITDGRNPYEELYPDPHRQWFEGHLGSWLFEKELKTYVDNLKQNGFAARSIRMKKTHIVTCCRILEHDLHIRCIKDIGLDSYACLKDLTANLNKSVSSKILFNFDGFVTYWSRSILKEFKNVGKNFGDDSEGWTEMREAVNIYLLDCEERGLRPKYIRCLKQSILGCYDRLTKLFGCILPKDITYHHLRELRKNLPDLKEQTRRVYLQKFGLCLELAYGRNPYHGANMRWAITEPVRTWIFRDDWQKLWMVASPTERLVLALAGGMGLRRSEIANLKRSHINGNIMSVHGKGSGPEGKVVDLEIPPTVLKVLNEYYVIRDAIVEKMGHIDQDNVLVLENKRVGAPATEIFVDDLVASVCAKAGIKATCHTFRRFFCLSMADNKIGPDTIARKMRHESYETTRRCYLLPDPRAMATATSTIEDAVFGGL